MRHILLLFFAIGLVSICFSHPKPKPAIGVIRWDAWVGGKYPVGKAVETSLAAAKWHYRLPFYARIKNDSTVNIDGSTPAVMDRELLYASSAGINYWAFVTYDETDPMSAALHNYLMSPNKRGVHFCLITEIDRWGDATNCQKAIQRFALMAGNPAAQNVLNGRPLLYLLGNDDAIKKNWQSLLNFRNVLKQYRDQVIKTTSQKPYIVFMGGSKADVDSLGIDAVSAYSTADWSSKTVLPYAALAKRTEAVWDDYKSAGLKCVPTVMTGADRRPRVEHPVFWESPELQNYPVAYSQATSAEFKQHLGNACSWIRTNPQTAEANTLIIYAWNEFDEGGWIEPTLNKDGSINKERLMVLKH